MNFFIIKKSKINYSHIYLSYIDEYLKTTIIVHCKDKYKLVFFKNFSFRTINDDLHMFILYVR